MSRLRSTPPHPSTRSHRTTVLTAVGALAAGSVLAVAAPASAAPLVDGYLEVHADFDDDGPATCALTSGLEAHGGAVVSSAAPGSRSVSAQGVITDSADPADVTSVAAAASARTSATEVAGSLGRLVHVTTLSASVQAAQGPGSACAADALATSELSTKLVVSEPGWLTLEAVVPGALVLELSLSSTSATGGELGFHVSDLEATQRFTHFFGAGSYELDATFHLPVETPLPIGRPTSASATGRLTASFAPAGSATAPAAGAARRFVDLPTERGCTSDSVSPSLRGPTRKLARVVYRVDGRRAATVRRPRPGKVTVLRGLRDDRPVTLRATVTTRKGKVRNVARTYLACSS
ncbi:hypothetical protein [Nocardioides sp. SYSU D00038]|uniref:hypothetical protein n=1 Tax=Nocardioides sp. SYSU D00038 TaxID=2812554 RepID=UPI0019684F51|nr:hypothetical protein [Nocardioides sp. SYSU D00038]